MPALTAIRGDQLRSQETTEFDEAVEEALIAIDRATKAFYLSRATPTKLQAYAQQAYIHFENALLFLAQMPAKIKETEEWRVWHDEAQNGLERIEQVAE